MGGTYRANQHTASGKCVQVRDLPYFFPSTTNMPRAVKPSGKSRHDPLYVQLGEDEQQAKYGKVTNPGKRRKSRAADGNDEETGEVGLCLGNGRQTRND